MNPFLDDFLDETDVSQMKVEHMDCFGMVWRGCQEVAFKQEGLEKITVGIAQPEASLNQAAELFERSPYLGHFSAKLIGKVFNALLNRGFKQLVFVVKIEINRALSDFGFFSYTVDGGSLEAVLSNHPAGRLKNLADAELAQKVLFFASG